MACKPTDEVAFAYNCGLDLVSDELPVPIMPVRVVPRLEAVLEASNAAFKELQVRQYQASAGIRTQILLTDLGRRAHTTQDLQLRALQHI